MTSHPLAIIHEPLEYGRGVGKTKEHDSRFEEAFVGDKGGLPLVTIFDVNIVIPQWMSNLVKSLVSLSLLMRLEMRGRG